MTETCKLCRFWRDGYDRWAGLGDCRRFPPSLSRDAKDGAAFPKTMGRDWCGEFSKSADTGAGGS